MIVGPPDVETFPLVFPLSAFLSSSPPLVMRTTPTTTAITTTIAMNGPYRFIALGRVPVGLRFVGSMRAPLSGDARAAGPGTGDGGFVGAQVRRDDPRVVHDVVRCSLRDDLAEVHGDESVRDRGQQREVVLDDQDAGAELLTDPEQQGPERFRLALGDAARRLVQQEHGRLV